MPTKIISKEKKAAIFELIKNNIQDVDALEVLLKITLDQLFQQESPDKHLDIARELISYSWQHGGFMAPTIREKTQACNNDFAKQLVSAVFGNSIFDAHSDPHKLLATLGYPPPVTNHSSTSKFKSPVTFTFGINTKSLTNNEDNPTARVKCRMSQGS